MCKYYYILFINKVEVLLLIVVYGCMDKTEDSANRKVPASASGRGNWEGEAEEEDEKDDEDDY